MESRWILLVSFFVAIIVEIGLPVTLAILIVRKLKVHWLVVLTGVLTFIGSQVVHIPLLQIPSLLAGLGLNVSPAATWPIGFYALYLGLMAGLCEETARWIGFKILKRKALSYKSAFALGIGHGGVESIIVGLLVLANVISMLLFNPQTLRASGVAEGTVQMGIAQVAQFWATHWSLPLAGGFERVTAISAQLLMSVMVWKSVAKRSWLWYLLAVVYHAVLDGVAVYLTTTGMTAWQLEGILSIFLIVDVIFLILFWKSEKVRENNQIAPAPIEPGA